MLFTFKFSNADKEFARSRVASLSASVSSSQLIEKRRSVSVNKVTRIIELIVSDAKKYHDTQEMGFLRRSYFAYLFKWALKEAGYPEDFISLVIEALIVSFARSKNI